MKMLLALLWVLWSFFCLTECVKGNETRLTRSDECPEGTYTASDGKSCCLCPKGFYLMNDCTSPLTNPRCEVCKDGTYLDHANHERKCEPCRTCGNNDLDLERFLPQISEILGCKVARQVVRREGLVLEAALDNITENNHNAEERAFQFLKCWYEKHGRKGAYRYLQRNLKEMNQNAMAEKVQELVYRANNGEVEENGV
ncbi:tumor necrosis factor receptor superfamily member 26 [Silurus asotus]|uniref:Tumor necrosis factor receptor superfamily member 26 n=1 Tax=Silurus asotus TaxID=30991 RepID=A0AAD5B396_SILAS|nr:tumor necrosis factor receptor superfamily member 26 [Silurus asotus]